MCFSQLNTGHSFTLRLVVDAEELVECRHRAIHVNNFSNATAFAGSSIVRPTTNSRNATANHSRDAVASSIVNRAPESLFLRLYFVISTSIGSASPTNSRRTRTRRVFVSIDNSVISPIPFSLLLMAILAVNASVASFELRRNARTSPSATARISSRWQTFLNGRFLFQHCHNRIPSLNRFGDQQRFGRVVEALVPSAFFWLNSPPRSRLIKSIPKRARSPRPRHRWDPIRSPAGKR